MLTKPEICYECDFFREDHRCGGYICVNPNSYYCDKAGIGKATRACHHGRLNPKLIELYPDTYGKEQT